VLPALVERCARGVIGLIAGGAVFDGRVAAGKVGRRADGLQRCREGRAQVDLL